MSEKKSCFVVTPIGDENTAIRRHIDGIIDQAIVPAIGDEFEIKVAHREYEIGSINDRVIQSVCNSDLVIANLTGLNPNVMFELGHAICSLSDSNIVMICNTAYCDTRLLPFDLGLKRQITYKFSEQITITPEEKKLFRKQLKDAFVAIRDKKW